MKKLSLFICICFSILFNLKADAVVTTADEINLIKNGHFDNQTLGFPDYWGFWSQNGGVAPIVVDGAAMCSPIASPNVWEYLLSQTGMNALPNIPYIFSFKAWSPVNRSIAVTFQDTPENNYNPYGSSSDPEANWGSSIWTINITPTPTTYTFHVVFDKMVPSTLQYLQFMLNATSDVVYIDDVSLAKVEDLSGIKVSLNSATLPASEGSATKLLVTTTSSWTANSDHSWLTVSPNSGTGEQTLVLTANTNTSILNRTANVTITADGFSEPQIITITQQGSKTPFTVTAGGLISVFSPDELAHITKLTLNGIIDARDFKTMRDDMPMLAEIDLSGVTIAAYSGIEGTSIWDNTTYPADAVPDCAFWNKNNQGKISLLTVNLPGSITSFRDYAFAGCNALSSINIPDGVISIGSHAFFSCRSLNAIHIPASVITINNYAFRFVNSQITVNGNNPNYSDADGVLFNKAKTTLIQCPISKVGNYTIPSTVSSVGIMAFEGCSGLSSVAIPSSVETIEYSAFWNCYGMSSLNIPSSVMLIKDQAFAYCNGLTSITVGWQTPLNLNSYPEVFKNVNKDNCTLNVPYGTASRYTAANQWQEFKIEQTINGFLLGSNTVNIAATSGSTATVNLTANVAWAASSDQSWLSVSPASGNNNQTLTFTAEANTSVGTRKAIVTVSATGVESQTITVTQSGSNAPINVTAGGLKALFTPEELATLTKLTLTGTIDARDFKTMRDDMPMLAEVDLSKTIIDAYSGSEGTNPTSWSNFIYSANSIPENAFYNYDSGISKILLTKFNLPNSITSIGSNAFNGCYNLMAIDFPSTIVTIGGSSFSGCRKIQSILIPSSTLSIGEMAFVGINFIAVATDNINFSALDGVLYNKNFTSIIQCPESKTGTFTIPSTVSKISLGSFLGCSTLTSIIIPSSVNSIGWFTFQNCNELTSIYAYPPVPVNLNSSSYVFDNVNKTTCTLNVPYGSKAAYQAANQWKDFTNIVEAANGFNLSTSIVSLDAATGSKATVKISANVVWTASSDQSWLSVSPASGNNDQTLTFTAEANTSVGTRKAIITVSATGVESQTITVTQSGSNAPINVTAGGLKALFTPEELASLTKLTLTGTIDARDFKTMRDAMPLLAEIDLSGVKIAAYTGNEGPGGTSNIVYLINTVPQYAFYNSTTSTGKNLNSVILPSLITAIGDWAFSNCSGFTSIIIPSSVTSIGYCSFYFSGGITSITIPASVSTIGISAFQGSTGMIIVDANNPYYSSLDGVLFNKQKTTLIQCTTSQTGSYVTPSSVTSIGKSAFSFCYNLTTINLPPSVKFIGENAFANCNSLTSINIPSSITYIENSAFWYCRKLDLIIAENGFPLAFGASTNVFTGVNKTTCTLQVPYGSKAAYQAANQWKDFTNIVEAANGFNLSASIVSLDAAAGSKATVKISANVVWTASSDQSWLSVSPASGNNDQTLTFTAEANTSIGTRKAIVTVSALSVESQTITVTQSGLNAPINVTAGGLKVLFTPEELATLTKLTLTGTIDARDFKTMRDDMPMLAQVDLSGVTIATYTGTEGTAGTSNTVYSANVIPQYAFLHPDTFAGKTSLISFKFPSTVIAIGDYAFFRCNGITGIDFSPSISSVGQSAFYDTGLTSLNIPSSITSIANQSFSYCSKLESITIPASLVNIGLYAFDSSDGLINVDSNNPNYSSLDGIMFNKQKTDIIHCPISKSGTYTVPGTVISIGATAFSNCKLLTSVTIPSSVTSIRYNAFFRCTSLVSATIPSSVNLIANQAFRDCTGLTSIYSNRFTPLDLSSMIDVFGNVNKTTCTLNVPYGSKAAYQAANQWKDFTNIVEAANGFNLSASIVSLDAAAGSKATVKISANVVWTASSDQSWLSVSPASGNNDQTLTFTAEANTSVGTRKATVTVSASGVESQTVTATQNGNPDAPLAVLAGGLKTSLTANELANLTKLKLTGTIDARDFKTMRDDMPHLAELDLSGVDIVTYTGTAGTAGTGNITYPANTIPNNAFLNNTPLTGLVSVALPLSATSIGVNAFRSTGLTSITLTPLLSSIGNYGFLDCADLSSIYIPSTLVSLGQNVFEGIGGSITVDPNNPNYSSHEGVLYNKNLSTLIQCPASKTGPFTIPEFVKTIGFFAFSDCINITSFIIPNSIVSIERYAFAYCESVKSIYVNQEIPVDLNLSAGVFIYIDKATTTLYVPYGSKAAYQAANQWKDFKNMVEMPGFKLSSTTAKVGAATGSHLEVNITSDVDWTASSDQAWLSVSPASGFGNGTLTLTATANQTNETRTAKVTVSAIGVKPQSITVVQAYPVQVLITKLFDFASSSSGKLPIASLLESDDYLYGSTAQGGISDLGTIFKIKKDGTEYTKLFEFKDSGTSYYPIGQLTLIDNTLYGTTVGDDYFSPASGTADYGSIFKINTDGTGFNILHRFNKTDGKGPVGSLVFYKGSLYGNTDDGGSDNHGTIFRISPNGTGFTKIADNTSSLTGERPENGITISNDVIYGVSTVDYGSVFSVNTDGTGLKKIFEMNGESGNFSYCKPLLINDELFITTSEGGVNGVGAIFKIKTDGTGFKVLYNFEGKDDDPQGSGFRNTSLVFFDGILYGTASGNGINDSGYIYQINMDGTDFTKLSDFDGEHGSFPYLCDLSIDKYKTIYGMTTMGGINNEGIIYKYSMNESPIANAGSDQSVNEGTTVTLIGSASSDPDNDALTYHWTAPAGIVLSSATVAQPSFTAPLVNSDKEYTFSLVVNDGTIDSPADQVKITVLNVNKAPIADAGTDKSVNEGTTTSLDGSASSDPDNDALTYHWIAPAGIVLSSETVAQPSFTAPEVDSDKEYTFSLVVNDGTIDSPANQLRITVLNLNKAPIANAGPDQTVNERETVSLNGAASSDADGDALTYHWTAPAGIAISSATAANPTFIAPSILADTDLNFTLVVNDGHADSQEDQLVIHVNQIDLPPVAEAGPDQSVYEGDEVTLEGTTTTNQPVQLKVKNATIAQNKSGSTDPDNCAINYQWVCPVDASGAKTTITRLTFSGPETTTITDHLISLEISDGLASGNLENALKFQWPIPVGVKLSSTIVAQITIITPKDPEEKKCTFSLMVFDGSVSPVPNLNTPVYVNIPATEIPLISNTVVKLSVTSSENTESVDYNYSMLVYDGSGSADPNNGASIYLSIPPTPIKLGSPTVGTLTIKSLPDQTVPSYDFSLAVCSGSESPDPDEGKLTYHWTAPEGISLSSETGSITTFIAPEVDADTDYTFSLVVDNGKADSQTDKVVVTVKNKNQLPIANAGADQSIYEGAMGSLAGTASHDPDGNALSYKWTAPSGIKLSSETVASPTFTAPEVGNDIKYTFLLVVNDGQTNSAPDEVVITVWQVNKAPIAYAGVDQSVNEGVAASLAGSASYDPDGEALSYKWTAPSGIKLSSETVANPTFTAPEVSIDTKYIFLLVVNDGQTNSAPDEVVITVLQVNKAPIADAGTDQSVNEGVAVSLDGSASNDPDGDALSYKWTAPSGIKLNSETVAKPSFTAPEVTQEKAYVFTLEVNDGATNSVLSEVAITIKNIETTLDLVSKIDQVVIPPSMVAYQLYLKIDGSYVLQDIKSIVMGDKTSCSVTQGEWIVLASPVQNSFDFIPTYAGNVSSWTEAKHIVVVDKSKNAIEINCIKPENSKNGIAEISGFVYEDVVSGTKSMSITKTIMNTGNPVVGALIQLFKKGGTNPIATAVTDSNGFYKFVELGISEYGIIVEIPGLIQSEQFSVTVSTLDPSVSVKFMVNTFTGIITDINPILESSVKIYPNPTKGKVQLKFNHLPEAGTWISIYDNLGRLILKLAADNMEKIINMEGNPAGLYFIKIDQKGTKTFKLVLE